MSSKLEKIIIAIIIIVLLIAGIKLFSSYISYTVAMRKARDAKRIEDFQNFRMALMIYYTEHNVYPNELADLMPRYLSEISFDPREGEPHKSSVCKSVIEEDTFSYYYKSTESGKNFTITTCLEEGEILTISSNKNE